MTKFRNRVTWISALIGLMVSASVQKIEATPKLADATKAAASCSSVDPDPAVTTPVGPQQPAVFKVVNGDVLCVKGTFHFNSPERIAAIPDPAAVKYLVIESGGGNVLPAIQLAELAERYGWLVIVSNSCYSSCASYVFLANTDKIVLKDSYVGWNGLPWNPKVVKENFDRQFAAQGNKLTFGATREQELDYVMASAVGSEKFFNSRGISPDLAGTAPEAGNTFSAGYAEQYKKAREAGHFSWTYSKHALADKWKVGRIIDMWEPADREAATANLQKRYGWQMFFFE